MKCPHCLENFFEQWSDSSFHKDADGNWHIRFCICPSCNKIIVQLGKKDPFTAHYIYELVRPRTISRSPLPPEVPSEFADDYKEACLVLSDSPKASAALSRRCLQNLLIEKASVKKDDLADQIQEILDSNKLPSYLADILDAVRNIGNFAAHPTKSKSTGEIVPVESGEAELNLDVIEGLFDFYFVQPEKIRNRKEELNKKLQDAGKPPMK